jgi:hypothetical protein
MTVPTFRRLLRADADLGLAGRHLQLADDAERRAHLGHLRPQDGADDVARAVLHLAALNRPRRVTSRSLA